MALHSTKQKEIIPVLIKFIHTKKREQNPLNIILCDQCYYDTKKINKYATQMQKIINKLLANKIQKHIRRSYTIIKWDSTLGYEDSLMHGNQ